MRRKVFLRMKLTNFEFFRDTPFNDFQNTFHFSNVTSRDNWFNNAPYITKKKEGVNFSRFRPLVSFKEPFANWYGYNYCRFKSDLDGNTWVYAYVIALQTPNVEVVSVAILIDDIMTYCQGNTFQNVGEIEIKRQHLEAETYKQMLPRLQLNSDILETSTKKYVYNEANTFKDYYVLFQCLSDLTADFGDYDQPKQPVAPGNTYDRMTSPLSLYVATPDMFRKMNEALKNFGWISQNIKNVVQMPIKFFDDDDLVPVNFSQDPNVVLWTLKDNNLSNKIDNFGEWRTKGFLAEKCGIDYAKEPHLFRSGYTTIEVYDWNGQSLLLEAPYIDNTTGFKMGLTASLGYVNKVVLYPKDYMSDANEKASEEVGRGTFLNNGLVYDVFNEIPVAVDSYSLARSSNANQRALENSKQLSNRFDNIINGTNGDTKSRIMDGLNYFDNLSSGVSGLNVASGLNLAKNVKRMYTDEYEYYRSQKAQFADMQLRPPSVSGSNNSVGFLIANGLYGYTLKLSAPDRLEMDKVRKYYNTFGFEMNERRIPDSLSSMSKMNFLQLTGNYIIQGVPIDSMERIKDRMEIGVKFWKPTSDGYPTRQTLLDNERV